MHLPLTLRHQVKQHKGPGWLLWAHPYYEHPYTQTHIYQQQYDDWSWHPWDLTLRANCTEHAYSHISSSIVTGGYCTDRKWVLSSDVYRYFCMYFQSCIHSFCCKTHKHKKYRKKNKNISTSVCSRPKPWKGSNFALRGMLPNTALKSISCASWIVLPLAMLAISFTKSHALTKESNQNYSPDEYEKSLNI